MKMEGTVRRFVDEKTFEDFSFKIAPGRQNGEALGLKWEATNDQDRIMLVAQSGEEAPLNAALGCRLTLPGWQREDYLMVPAAVYDGNRFALRKMEYPPIPVLSGDMTPDCPPLIADIPHFDTDASTSEIRLRAGDGSLPWVCLWQRETRSGLIVRYDLGEGWENGVTLREDLSLGTLQIELSAPALRMGGMYRFPEITTKAPMEDRPVTLAPGDGLSLSVQIHAFPCAGVEALYERYFELAWGEAPPLSPHELPLSAACGIIVNKYNRDSWFALKDVGFYAVGCCDGFYGYWQAGWVGGGINLYPLWLEGDAATRARCDKTLSFIFEKAQAPGGLFYGIGDGQRFYGDHFKRHEDISFHLLRKSADMLYFVTALLILRQRAGETLPPAWLEGIGRCCGAFEQIWNKHRRLGQFVDLQRNEIISGSTSSAGIAPAGLCLAARLLDNPAYIKLAGEIGEMLAEQFLARGFSNGGPGEILSCPDSESACGMLESFTTLYECTGDTRWLNRAKQSAYQYASWVMPNDYPFPQTSEFGRLHVHSAGCVWANAQNKHGAPGACTGSASALYRLYLYTMDIRFLHVVGTTAHNITQYLSRADRPIHDYNGQPLADGWMCERVSTSDWEGMDKIGGVFAGPCWCDISAMLCYTDLPGLVVNRSARMLTILDHIDVRWAGQEAIEIRNPCAYPAVIWIHIHDGIPLPATPGFLRDQFVKVELAAGETRVLPCDGVVQ